MRFGKIQYLNLLPFDVFLKQYPLPSFIKQAAFLKRSYPSKLNQLFLFKQIDSGFISSIAGRQSHYKHKATKSGIISNGAVWSVLNINLESKKDFESDTSNALSKVLNLHGKVLIGDKALQFYFNNKDSSFIDMGEEWKKRENLPFVFGRMCANKYIDLYKNISLNFNKKPIKIPYFMLKKASLESNLESKQIKNYLKRIYYKIGHKELKSLERFYRACRINNIKSPRRIYKKAKYDSNK